MKRTISMMVLLFYIALVPMCFAYSHSSEREHRVHQGMGAETPAEHGGAIADHMQMYQVATTAEFVELSFVLLFLALFPAVFQYALRLSDATPLRRVGIFREVSSKLKYLSSFGAWIARLIVSPPHAYALA